MARLMFAQTPGAGKRGAIGPMGPSGSAATISVGTTSTLSAGSSATVSNSGSSSAAVFNFGIPQGQVGATGPQGNVGPAGPQVIGSPNILSPAFGTVYQATDPTKPSFISVMIDTAYSITVAGTQADTVELRTGTTSIGLASGASGTAVATFRASLTGIALAIGMGLGQRNQLTAWLYTGGYWCVRRVSGTLATISSATDQSLG